MTSRSPHLSLFRLQCYLKLACLYAQLLLVNLHLVWIVYQARRCIRRSELRS